MYADACCFASSIQPFHNVVFPVLHVQDLAMVVRWNAAHAVVHSRENWNRLFCDINARKDRSCLGNTRQPLVNDLLGQMRKLQVDMILSVTTSATLNDF